MVPAHAERLFAGGAAHSVPQVGVGEQHVQTLGESLRAAPGDEVAGPGVVHEGLESADPGDDDRGSAGHGLERGEPEALGVGGQHIHVGRAVVSGQPVLWDRAGESHRVPDTEFLGYSFQAFHLGVAAGIASYYQDSQVACTFQQWDGAEEDVYALERLDASDVEDDVFFANAEFSAGVVLLDGGEHIQIHARGYHLDLMGGGIVQADDVVFLLLGGYDYPVRVGHYERLYILPELRFALAGARPELGLGECVKGGRVGDVPLAAEGHADPAGEPVVAVDYVVARLLGPLEVVEFADEGGDVVEEVFLGGVYGACVEMYHPGAVFQFDYPGVVGVVVTGKDINLVSFCGEFTS